MGLYREQEGSIIRQKYGTELARGAEREREEEEEGGVRIFLLNKIQRQPHS